MIFRLINSINLIFIIKIKFIYLSNESNHLQEKSNNLCNKIQCYNGNKKLKYYHLNKLKIYI